MEKKTKYTDILIGVLIIFTPILLTGEGPQLSQQFYPSGITFVVGVDYLIRAACTVIGLLHISAAIKRI